MQFKVDESQQAISAGATELDVVLNRTQLQPGHYTKVYDELSAIRAISPPEIILKLILETSQLSRDEIIAAGVIAGYVGFDFIKTSTGFCGRGASVEDVELMVKVADIVGKNLGKERMKVKASGGVRTLEDAKKMLDAGAERIGASAGVPIVKQFLGEGKGAEGSGY
jgi:deoxyribose-phosphate aldolase